MATVAEAVSEVKCSALLRGENRLDRENLVLAILGRGDELVCFFDEAKDRASCSGVALASDRGEVDDGSVLTATGVLLLGLFPESCLYAPAECI